MTSDDVILADSMEVPLPVYFGGERWLTLIAQHRQHGPAFLSSISCRTRILPQMAGGSIKGPGAYIESVFLKKQTSAHNHSTRGNSLQSIGSCRVRTSAYTYIT